MRNITIYTDGACSHNGTWDGGWAFGIITDRVELWKNGHQPNTTNNQMELMAIIEALKHLKVPSNITLYTDSMYNI